MGSENDDKMAAATGASPSYEDEEFKSSASSPSQNIPVRRGRTSLCSGLESLVHAGGVNSLDRFARSWTRAAGYLEITPTSTQTFVYSDRWGGQDAGFLLDEENMDARKMHSYDDQSDCDEELDSTPVARLLQTDSHQPVPSPRFNFQSHSALYPHYGSYGSIVSIKSIHSLVGGGLGGSTGSRLIDGSSVQAASLFGQPGALTADMKEREPLLVKAVEGEDGKLVPIIVGQSTLPQTIFNSVNVLVGTGILSLPLGLKYSGWVIGIVYLVFSALITKYTAKLLARCLDKAQDKTLVTYADIGYAAYGHTARLWISGLFSMELLTACVALIILFADSLHTLIPSVSVTGWKIVAGLILTPLSFLPLRVLSFSSVLGISCSVGILATLIIDGLIKPAAPGSLWDPMETRLFPSNWYMVPMSFGLLMSPWGGHSVFPNIYKDMRHPHKYTKGVHITYGFTCGLDFLMAVVGYLMFGDHVREEITSNALSMRAYPRSLRILMIIFISIIPLTKTPLSARPIICTLDGLFGVDGRVIPGEEGMAGMSSYACSLLRISIRILTNALFVCIAILFPYFDQVVGLLGSFLCYSICVILPMFFYLKICGSDIPMWEKRMNFALIAVSTILGAAGTVWTFLPAEIDTSRVN